jgi:hypothetical protein
MTDLTALSHDLDSRARTGRMVVEYEPLPLGAVIEVRRIRVIDAGQSEEGQTQRADRLLAASQGSRWRVPQVRRGAHARLRATLPSLRACSTLAAGRTRPTASLVSQV